jgi:ABC-type sugar transport system ATPase subunit
MPKVSLMIGEGRRANVASIKLVKVAKSFSDGTEAVHGLDLEIADGEYTVLVGPSGCGKTTILRIIAGLEQPSHGRVHLDKQDVTDLPPQKRNLAMVFQTPAVYPHKTVRDNLGFSMRLHGVARNILSDRVDQVANSLNLSALLERKSGQLSGGERQRVALGRAMTRRPKAFLLDEPLSNLDAQLRLEMRGELTRIHREMATTTVHVTHDQEEAMDLGNRVGVLQAGKLQQIGPPGDVYRRPVNIFVAGFIGTPAMNFLPARLHTDNGKLYLVSPWLKRKIALTLRAENAENVVMGIRPHDIRLVNSENADAQAVVETVNGLGREEVIEASLIGKTDGGFITIVRRAEFPIERGRLVGLAFAPEKIHMFDPISDRRLN